MTDLKFCIVRQLLQPMSGNVLLNNAVGPPLAGFDVSAQQSCEK